MSKELEALEGIKYVADVLKDNHKIGNRDIANQEIKEMVDRLNYRIPIIKQSLQRLEAIDNANPSEALESSDEMFELSCDGRRPTCTLYEVVKQALLKAQEQEKVLEIIKEKEVNLGMLKTCKTVEQYNAGCRIFERNELTQEEFDLLKRYFE